MVPEYQGKNVMAEGRVALALCILLVLSSVFKLEVVAVSDVILRTKCYFSVCTSRHIYIFLRKKKNQE